MLYQIYIRERSSSVLYLIKHSASVLNGLKMTHLKTRRENQSQSLWNMYIWTWFFITYKTTDTAVISFVCIKFYTAKPSKYIVVIFFQLLANFFIFACANGAGIFTHYSTELSRRKAFLETRKCIENRLKSQKANQNQV